MIELLQIIFFSLVFVLLLFLPLNIFSRAKFFNNIDLVEKTSLNLAINLNILLLLSFLPLSIQSIQIFTISIYLLGLASSKMLLIIIGDLFLVISTLITIYTGFLYTYSTFKK